MGVMINLSEGCKGPGRAVAGTQAQSRDKGNTRLQEAVWSLQEQL